MYVPHYRWPIALLDIHLTCGISFLLRSVNLILFTLLLINLILNTSLHHIHQLRSHHLSPLGFSLQCWNSSPIYVIFRFLDCLHGSWTWNHTKFALVCVCFSVFFLLIFVSGFITCAKFCWPLSAFWSTYCVAWFCCGNCYLLYCNTVVCFLQLFLFAVFKLYF